VMMDGMERHKTSLGQSKSWMDAIGMMEFHMSLKELRRMGQRRIELVHHMSLMVRNKIVVVRSMIVEVRSKIVEVRSKIVEERNKIVVVHRMMMKGLRMMERIHGRMKLHVSSIEQLDVLVEHVQVQFR
jgi:hypothetical protein